jgi:branched-chain amino acid transport system permease protein
LADFVQFVLGGLATGAIYGCVALTLVIVLRTSGVVNFAQGEMATLTTFVAWSLIEAGVPFGLAAAIVVAMGFLSGAAVERVIVRRLAREAHIAAIIATIGLFTLINGADTAIWSGDSKPFPSPLPSAPLHVAGISVSGRDLSTLGVIAVLLVVVHVVLERTHLGLTMRATASNRRSAALAGIDVGRALAMGWGLSAAVGAIAGLLLAPRLTLEPQMMVGPLLYAFAALALGGFSSIVGAVAGGLALGVGQALLAGYVPLVGNDLSFPVALVLIVVVLLVRPGGLFGREVVQRV